MAKNRIVCPRHITGNVRKIYLDIMRKAIDQRTYGPGDEFMVESTAYLIDQFRTMRKIKKPNIAETRTMVSIAGQISRILKKLRMTPSSRPGSRGRPLRGTSKGVSYSKSWENVLTMPRK